MAVLNESAFPFKQDMRVDLEQASRTLGVQIQHFETDAPAGLRGGLATMIRGRVEALLIINTAFLADHRQRLRRTDGPLPTRGASLTLGTDTLCQRPAVFADKILRGAIC